MTSPDLQTVERYRDAAIALLPPGHAFSKSIDGPIAELLTAIGVEPARLHEQAERLLVNYDPARADELLSEWEEALGLQARGTLEERQGALIQKLSGRTSHAKSVFENAALELGYGHETWLPLLHIPDQPGFVGAAPAGMLSGRWRFTIDPDQPSTAISYAALFQFGDGSNEYIYIIETSPGSSYLLVIAASTILAAPIAFAAHQQVTIDLDLPAGLVTISGASAGNGTFVSQAGPWQFPQGRLDVGQRFLGASPFLGRIIDIESHSRAGLEFVRFPPCVAGTATAGSPCYGDEWANVVRIYVPVDTQTADETLLEAFEYLRRSHGFLDIILEGPMGAERKQSLYFNQRTLTADDDVTTLTPFQIRYEGFLSLQVHISDGAGAAPTDAPIGVWEIWVSTDGARFTRLTSGAIDAELAKVAANGNQLVDQWAIFTGIPGTWIKIRYNRTSGGGGNSRASVWIATW